MALLNDILFFRIDPNINKFPREISAIFNKLFFYNIQESEINNLLN